MSYLVTLQQLYIMIPAYKPFTCKWILADLPPLWQKTLQLKLNLNIILAKMHPFHLFSLRAVMDQLSEPCSFNKREV